MFNHPIVPAILLGFSAFRLFTGTATWWTAVSALAAGWWLADSWKKWQAARDAAESPSTEDSLQSPSALPPAAPSAGAPGITREQIQQLRGMIDHNRRRKRGELPEQQLPSEQEILATAQPAILLHRSTLPVPLDHPARSYLGGLPRLPAELPWPQVEKHETFAMTFLAQIDLAELPVVPGSALPREGTVYFFTDMNNECPEADDCRVLYHPGDASKVPLRQLPENSRPYGVGEEPWPWLPESSVWARASFRFPLEFTVFDSVRDYLIVEGWSAPPSRNRDVFKRLMAAEFARRFAPRDPPPRNAWETLSEDRDDWPFAWAAIEFGARSIAHAARSAAQRREAAGVKADFERIADAAGIWVERAAHEKPEAVCDAPTRSQFLEVWRTLSSEVEAISRSSNIHEYDRGRELSHVLSAACYVCASNGAASSIPEPYRLALEHLNDAGANFPRHQMLGHGEKVQWAPIQYAEGVLLLQMLGDPALGWHTNGGCAYQFWISPDALKERDFRSVEMTLECD